jgi:hypothetical protein
MRQLLVSGGIAVAMYFIWVFCLNELNFQKWGEGARVFLCLWTACVIALYNVMKDDVSKSSAPPPPATGWDVVYQEYSDDNYPPFGGPFHDAQPLIDWLKLNFNAPTRKGKL